jgi:hypothetical protein
LTLQVRRDPHVRREQNRSDKRERNNRKRANRLPPAHRLSAMISVGTFGGEVGAGWLKRKCGHVAAPAIK